MTISECYQILNLQPQASLEEIDFAYSKERIELVRQGRKSEVANLTMAYHQLKDHTLNHSIDQPSPPDIHLPEHQIVAQLDRRLKAHKIQSTVQIVARELQIQLQNRQRAVDPSIAKRVMAWLTSLVPDGVETVLICEVRSSRSPGWQQKFQIDAAIKEANTDPYSFQNRYVNFGALPLAALLAIVIQLLGFPKILLRPFHIWIHEFGHAIVAWLAGHAATPLPFGWTNVGEDRSPIVYLCFLILLLVLFGSGWRERKFWAMGIAAVLAIGQFYMTWIMPIDSYQMWLYFGGVGGEIYLSTAIIACFYFPLPDKFRWDFWRYIFLIIAMFTFTESLVNWHQIKTGAADIPWGTMFGGQGDAGGDMNQLSQVYGWSDAQIVNTYSQLSHICLFLLITIYVVFGLKSWHKNHWRQLRR